MSDNRKQVKAGASGRKRAQANTSKSKGGNVNVRILKSTAPSSRVDLRKADTSVQLTRDTEYGSIEWLPRPSDWRAYKTIVDQSTILPQCIRAYKNNIAGFGIGVRYVDDAEEDAENTAEFERAEEIIDLLSCDRDTKEEFEELIELRETYGIGYLEVIRNLGGDVTQIECIHDVPSVEKSVPHGNVKRVNGRETTAETPIDVTYYRRGKEYKHDRYFRKYRQTINGKTVYYKEFGDPRTMNRHTGEYQDGIARQDQANELLEFALGSEPYGTVRWVGQILGIQGSRLAEGLNYNYFENGRHTPLLIMIRGGTLTEESFEKLQAHMNEIKGESGQHAFMVLETDLAEGGSADGFQPEKPEVEIKDIANILQKDELFQDYIDNTRRRAQSAFQLPDLYVAYTTDFNRATAQTAQEVTESQVFQPERKSLAWAINNRLLNGYRFKHVEAYFMDPDISNPDDLFKIMTIANNAGGLTPNKAKDILFQNIGEGDKAEDYPDEWGNIPIAVLQAQSAQAALEVRQPDTSRPAEQEGDKPAAGTEAEPNEPDEPAGGIAEQLDEQIKKAAAVDDTNMAVVAVMKEVRNLLASPPFQQGGKVG